MLRLKPFIEESWSVDDAALQLLTSASCKHKTFTFITRFGFDTQTLAYMLDSLVRVSRRVGWNHFANISSILVSPQNNTCNKLLSKLRSPGTALAYGYDSLVANTFFPQSHPWREIVGYNQLQHGKSDRKPTFLLPASHECNSCWPMRCTEHRLANPSMEYTWRTLWFQAVPF